MIRAGAAFPDPPKNHARRCCCELCDPTGDRTAAINAKNAERRAVAEKVRAELALRPPAPPRPRWQPRNTDIDRRFRQLVREHGIARALQILDAEGREPT